MLAEVEKQRFCSTIIAHLDLQSPTIFHNNFRNVQGIEAQFGTQPDEYLGKLCEIFFAI